ncbi:carboxypeptidase regulatory-like domain-containing protein [Singulisphaera sp. Ch08]|uniref:Carboxypeptidase regulatory-like domain-containing protein n=1 Tax=Singulisphaera sp. Ch08 TaxID=3120278 RepID=A0AAU7C994_9BACT
MNEHAWEWAESLGHWALAWTLVVVAVGAWIRLGRPSRASLRYGGWLLATFAGLVLAPLVVWLGPWVSWHDAVALVRRPANLAASPVGRFTSWFEGVPAMAIEGRDGAALAPTASSTWILPPQIPKPVAAVRPRAEGGRWPELALLIWGAGALVFAVRLGRDAIRVRALLAAATGDVPAELAGELEPARVDLGLRRRVRVGVHPEIQAPMCVGLLRPTLLWPTAAHCPMTSSQRRLSLVHELAHLKHGDDWVALLAEIWRCLAWFYLPIHFLLDRLRREREYCCDDVASSRSEGPEGYARWLLDLAPVRVKPPALASSLLGGADLAVRVRRLLDRDSRPASPLTCRQVMMLGGVGLVLLGVSGSVRLVGFVAHAIEAEPADALLPEIEPKALAIKLETAWKDYEAGLLEVEFDEERDSDPFAESRGQERKSVDIKFPGRFQYGSDGRLWRTEFDSMMPNSGARQLVPDRWVTGFDGERHYHWNVRANEVTWGESNPSALALEPRALFWPSRKNLIELLNDATTKVSQKTVDGVRCYLLEKTTRNPSGEWRTEYAISPRRSHLAVEMAYYRNGHRYALHRLQDLRQAERGLWIPSRILSESWSVFDDGSRSLMSRRSMRIVRYEPAKAIARDDFTLTVPFNVTVKDLTDGSAWTTDPWWPEVRELLRDRFAWSPRDLSPLRQLVSHCDGKVEGQPVPPIEASLWINSGPVDWGQLRGKVALIDFSSVGGRHEKAAAIRALGELYKGAGLRVISVLDSKDDPDAARQYVKELRLTHPVAVDLPRAAGFGATMQAFGMKYDSSVFLVDHLGKVRQVKEPGGLIGPLVQMLRDAGSKDVLVASLDPPQLVRDEELDAIGRAFQDWIKQADDGGSLAGTIVDMEGRPIQGAEVRVHAEARILMHPGSFFVIPGRTTHLAVTGDSGMFLLPNLCKGNYSLRISAPGFATIERKTLIESTLGEVVIDAVMGQADAISGQVMDQQGKPIADVDVTISERRIARKDGTQTNYNDTLEMKTTDAKGAFRFNKLPEGDYTLTLKSMGFSQVVRKNVPAGANNLELTLERVRP